MSYDPDERRDTPLARKLEERIRREGAVSVAEYMRACLQDPEHGYYRNAPAIGAGADFITAPEISQIFGELIGLWCAVVWQQMGSPAKLDLIELGPGRGTLMRDALRAARSVPGFCQSLSVELVESNETLRKAQRAALANTDVPVTFYSEPSAVLTEKAAEHGGAAIVIGNEFLDALPVEQLEFQDASWRSRTIGLVDEHLAFLAGAKSASEPVRLPGGIEPEEGAVLEVCPGHDILAEALAGRSENAPVAALFIDYGHMATGWGDTLQGIAGQAFVSPFLAPGETDLSAHVDFEQFAQVCRGAGLAVDGAVTQSEFLGSLGIMERASRLMAANPAKAAEIEAGVARLMSPSGMGSRFKAIGIRSQSLPTLPGFASLADSR